MTDRGRARNSEAVPRTIPAGQLARKWHGSLDGYTAKPYTQAAFRIKTTGYWLNGIVIEVYGRYPRRALRVASRVPFLSRRNGQVGGTGPLAPTDRTQNVDEIEKAGGSLGLPRCSSFVSPRGRWHDGTSPSRQFRCSGALRGKKPART